MNVALNAPFICISRAITNRSCRGVESNFKKWSNRYYNCSSMRGGVESKFKKWSERYYNCSSVRPLVT